MNLGALVSSALRTAKSLGVAGSITITNGTASFTVDNAVREDPSPTAPPSGGNKSSSAPRFTVAADECDFVPDYGHILTDANGSEYRILAANPVAPGGVDVLYTIEVAS